MEDFLSLRAWIIFFGVESIVAGVLWMLGALSPLLLVVFGLCLLAGLWVWESHRDWLPFARQQEGEPRRSGDDDKTKPRPLSSANHQSAPGNQALAGFLKSGRDDFDLIPIGPIIRATRSDDGIDVSALIRFRNRSKNIVHLKTIPDGVHFSLDGKDAGHKSSGIGTPIPPERSAALSCMPIRIYHETDPVGSARFAVMFGLSRDGMRTILDMNYEFKIRSYPKNKSEDAVLEVDMIADRTAYYVKDGRD